MVEKSNKTSENLIQVSEVEHRMSSTKKNTRIDKQTNKQKTTGKGKKKKELC